MGWFGKCTVVFLTGAWVGGGRVRGARCVAIVLFVFVHWGWWFVCGLECGGGVVVGGAVYCSSSSYLVDFVWSCGVGQLTCTQTTNAVKIRVVVV